MSAWRQASKHLVTPLCQLCEVRWNRGDKQQWSLRVDQKSLNLEKIQQYLPCLWLWLILEWLFTLIVQCLFLYSFMKFILIFQAFEAEAFKYAVFKPTWCFVVLSLVLKEEVPRDWGKRLFLFVILLVFPTRLLAEKNPFLLFKKKERENQCLPLPEQVSLS